MNLKEYKKGQQVRVKTFEEIRKIFKNNNYNAYSRSGDTVVFNKEMGRWCGEILTLSRNAYVHFLGNEAVVKAKEDGGRWVWAESMLCEMNDTNKMIHQLLREKL